MLEAFKYVSAVYESKNVLFQPDNVVDMFFRFRSFIHMLRFLLSNRESRVLSLRGFSLFFLNELELSTLLFLSLDAFYDSKKIVSLPPKLQTKLSEFLGSNTVSVQSALWIGCALV